MKRIALVLAMLGPIADCDEPFGLRREPQDRPGKYRVRLFACDEAIQEWRTDDHYATNGVTRFIDRETGRETFVTGNVVIDRIDGRAKAEKP